MNRDVIRLTLVLPIGEADILAKLARSQYRDIRGQAHYMITQALAESGLLPDPARPNSAAFVTTTPGATGSAAHPA